MNDIFPAENRRQVYANFARTYQLQLPNLELTPSWASFLTYVGLTSILGGLACSLILLFFFGFGNWVLLIPVAGIALTWVISTLLNPMRTHIALASVRQFTQQVFALNYATMINNQGVSRKEVEMVIDHIVIDVAGVEPEEVSPQKKFGDDLELD